MPIAEAKELLNLRQLPASGSYYTLAGFAMARLGRLPTEGDRFSWEDWRFEIVDMDANRIDKLMAIPRKQGG
jgi:putative hemolysin